MKLTSDRDLTIIKRKLYIGMIRSIRHEYSDMFDRIKCS